MRRAYAVFFLLGMLASPSAWAQPKEKVTTEYYDIEGNRKKDLIKEMKKKGVREKGGRYHAHTHWRVNWNYRYAPASDGCRVHSAVSDLEIHYFLPRWVPGDGVSQELIEKWENYYTALKLHEEGHAEIGRKAAREIEAALPRLGRGLSCGDIEAAITAEAGRILDQYHEEESRYDASTKNGRTQGAFFD